MLHRLLDQEASAGSTVCQGCRHCFALCAAVGSVCGALFVVAMGGHPSFAGSLALVHDVGPKGLPPPSLHHGRPAIGSRLSCKHQAACNSL